MRAAGSDQVELRVLIATGGNDRALAAALADVKGVRGIVPRDRSEAAEKIPSADALITSDHAWGPDFAEALRGATGLRWVQLTTAGFDRLERLGVPRDVVISTIGGAGAGIVAEHALLLLLALIRQLPAMQSAQNRGEWVFDAMANQIRTLRGQRLGVLGFGHIGQTVARLAAVFGADVIGIARTARRDPAGSEVVPIADLHDVLRRCDALVVCLPLTNDTAGLLDAPAFAEMKPGACVVNVSRGRIIVTQALVAALESGRLGGAALDVTDPEPLPADHPLWMLPNVVITPHVAWAGGGTEARRIIEQQVVDNVRRFARGEPLRDVAAVRHL